MGLFTETFDFALPAWINFVGGGGKTSLILRLLEEFSASVPAIYATTTRIHPPHPADGLVMISCDKEDILELLLMSAVREWSPGRRFVVTHAPHSPDLAHGVSPGFSGRLDPISCPVLLNEGDGARSMSIKMPREGEPVLIEGANYLVPVIGLDCLHKPLGPETLFRWELAAQRLKFPAGKNLDAVTAAAILFHPEGVCKGWTPDMSIVPFINKADTELNDGLALELAQALLANRNFPVHRVVWGSVQCGKAISAVGNRDAR